METLGLMTPKNGGASIDQMEIRLQVMEAIIPKFHALEDRVSTFIDRYETREELREKLDARRSKIHFSLLAGLISLIVGCALALFSWVLAGHHTVVRNESNVTLPRTPTEAVNPPY